MSKDSYPSCFGVLDSVFPKTESGLRSTPDSCLSCSFKTECLRTAMKGRGGLEVQEELVDRAYESGMMTFLQRWSKKKNFQRKLRENKKKRHKGSGS